MARWALEGQGVRTSGFLGLRSQMKGEWRSEPKSPVLVSAPPLTHSVRNEQVCLLGALVSSSVKWGYHPTYLRG